MLHFSVGIFAQQTSRSINYETHFWTSVNSTFKVTNHWGAIADLHIRRTNFIKDPSFYFARIGAMYWFNNQTTAAIGYGNLISPTSPTSNTWNVEFRTYQQLQHANKTGKVNVLQRLRNEQRWRFMANNQNAEYTNRLRYLLSVGIPVFKNPALPSLVLADEILMQWSKNIIYNPLEQNRLFIGIRQPLGKNWSYDCGYMYVFQQKQSGYEYNAFNTFRLFFYYNFSNNQIETTNQSGEE